MQHVVIDRSTAVRQDEYRYPPRVSLAILTASTAASWALIILGVRAIF